jgi:hypothetical protein
MKVRTRAGLAAICGVAVVLGFVGLTSADDANVKLGGSQKVLQSVLQKDIEELQQALSAPKPEKKNLKRAKMLALVVGLTAKSLGSDGEHAAMAAQAGKILSALGSDNLAAAKDGAKALGTSKSVDSAQIDLIKAALYDSSEKDWDRDLSMQLFKTVRAGGLGIESKIKAWSEKAPTGKDLDLVVPFAHRTAVVAAALKEITPPKGKSADEWKKYASDMHAAAEQVLELASKEKPDAKSLVQAFNRLDHACTVCHEKFK